MAVIIYLFFVLPVVLRHVAVDGQLELMRTALVRWVPSLFPNGKVNVAILGGFNYQIL